MAKTKMTPFERRVAKRARELYKDKEFIEQIDAEVERAIAAKRLRRYVRHVGMLSAAESLSSKKINKE